MGVLPQKSFSCLIHLPRFSMDCMVSTHIGEGWPSLLFYLAMQMLDSSVFLDINVSSVTSHLEPSYIATLGIVMLLINKMLVSRGYIQNS